MKRITLHLLTKTNSLSTFTLIIIFCSWWWCWRCTTLLTIIIFGPVTCVITSIIVLTSLLLSRLISTALLIPDLCILFTSSVGCVWSLLFIAWLLILFLSLCLLDFLLLCSCCFCYFYTLYVTVCTLFVLIIVTINILCFTFITFTLWVNSWTEIMAKDLHLQIISHYTCSCGNVFYCICHLTDRFRSW